MLMAITYTVLEKNLIKLRKNFEDFKVLTDWFFETYIILNLTKCNYMYLSQNKKRDIFESDNIYLNISKHR